MLWGNAFILIATIFWGVNIPVNKDLIPQWMSADGISAVRLLGGCVLMWIASLFIKCDRIARQDWIKLILGGAVGMFSFIFLFTMSLRYANPIDVSIIMTLPPAFVVLFGIIFRHQRPGWMEYAGLGAGFLGALIVILRSSGGHAGSDNMLGNLLALASTLCYAFYLIILQKPSHTYRPISLMRWVFLFSAIPALALIPSLAQCHIWHADVAAPWVEIGFVLFCPTFIAYFMVAPAIKLIGSELVSIYQYLMPVVASIASVIMGLATLHVVQVIAMVVIIAGMVLTNIGKVRRRKKAIAAGEADSQM